MKVVSLTALRIRRRRFVGAVAALTFLFVGISLPALASDQPPMQAGTASPTTATARISATIEFGIRALDRALEQRVPRRLATFDDRTTRCWHRRIFRREVDVDCVYSGFVERTGPISLRAENGRLLAAVPIYGAVSGQGIGRFARLLHGRADGQLIVYASARPRLRPDWTVALDMSEGFRWAQPPILRILGFSINLSRYVEPRVREQVERVQADALVYLRSLDLRDKAQTAWRQAFAAVKIYDTPEIWLRMTPQTMAFAGMRARGDVLEGSLEMTGETETSIGGEPPPNAPTPLPPLAADVSEPGRFEIVVPINIDYDAIRAKMQDVLTAMNNGGLALPDIRVYPSGDKIVFGLGFGGAQGDSKQNWIYLTASPHLDAGSQTIQFPDVAVSTTPESMTSSLAEWLKDDSHLRALRQQLRVGYQAELDKIVASANARLSRSLGNGFRTEAHLSSSGLANVQLLPEGIRADFHADGNLRILYGL